MVRKIKEADTIDDIINATENPFVADLQGNNLIYNKDFYIAMYKKQKEGMSPLEAYEACGFSVEKLGENRAYAAARRAMKMGEADGFTSKPSSYDGSVERELMGELTPEEELAYLKARNIYLERFIELQKKMPSILAELRTSLKKEKQK